MVSKEAYWVPERVRKFGEFEIITGLALQGHRSSYYDGLFEQMKPGECVVCNTQTKAQNMAAVGRNRGYEMSTRSDKTNNRYLVFFHGKGR